VFEGWLGNLAWVAGRLPALLDGGAWILIVKQWQGGLVELLCIAKDIARILYVLHTG